MEVDTDLIRKVASVARLNLTDDECEKFVPELKEVLEFFKKLENAETDGLRPSFHPIDLKNALREDEVKESLTPELALKNTEHKQDNYFKGPGAV